MTKKLLCDLIPKLYKNIAPIKNEKVWSAINPNTNHQNVIIKYVTKHEIIGTKLLDELNIGPRLQAIFNYQDDEYSRQHEIIPQNFMVTDRLDGDMIDLLDRLQGRPDFDHCIKNDICPKIFNITRLAHKNGISFGDVHLGNYAYSINEPKKSKELFESDILNVGYYINIYRIDMEHWDIFNFSDNIEKLTSEYHNFERDIFRHVETRMKRRF